MPELSSLFDAAGFLKWDGAGNTDADFSSQDADDLAADPALTATYEALVDRTGAATGDVPTLQADGTLDFATPTGGGGGATNLTWDAATSKVASDTGTDATLTAVDGTNPGLMTVADKSKLNGIETLADVTDATNVAAAGAVMESDTSTAAMGFVIDEDNMASDSATKVPTQQSVKAYVDSASSGAFYGVHLTSTQNATWADEEPLEFTAANEDSDSFWTVSDPSKITVPAGQGGWYFVGADITTLGTDYSGPSNDNVQIAVLKNWDGVATQLDHYVCYERFNNENGSNAHGNSLLQPVLLAAGDVLQVVLIGSAGTLLVESNPSDGLPSGYLTDTGPGTLSPHFYVLRAGPGLPGPKGDTGATGAAGVVQSVVAGTNVSVDNTDPANPVVSASGGGGSGTFVARAYQSLTDKLSFSGTGLEQHGTEEATFDNALLPSTTGVTVYAQYRAQVENTTSTSTLVYQVEISLDGGATWSAGTAFGLRQAAGGNAGNDFGITNDHQVTGTVTGDIQARVRVSCSTGASTSYDLYGGRIAMEILV